MRLLLIDRVMRFLKLYSRPTNAKSTSKVKYFLASIVSRSCCLDERYVAGVGDSELSLVDACVDVKDMHVVVVDAVLGFGLLHQLESCANYLWILLEYSLPILCSIEGHF
jgi:hypothetical protein